MDSDPPLSRASRRDFIIAFLGRAFSETLCPDCVFPCSQAPGRGLRTLAQPPPQPGGGLLERICPVGPFSIVPRRLAGGRAPRPPGGDVTERRSLHDVGATSRASPWGVGSGCAPPRGRTRGPGVVPVDLAAVVRAPAVTRDVVVDARPRPCGREPHTACRRRWPTRAGGSPWVSAARRRSSGQTTARVNAQWAKEAPGSEDDEVIVAALRVTLELSGISRKAIVIYATEKPFELIDIRTHQTTIPNEQLAHLSNSFEALIVHPRSSQRERKWPTAFQDTTCSLGWALMAFRIRHQLQPVKKCPRVPAISAPCEPCRPCNPRGMRPPLAATSPKHHVRDKGQP